MAFTREEDSEAAAANLADRPNSTQPTLVTASGLAQLEAALESARVAYAVAQTSDAVSADRTAMARATRDLRYYASRRASAVLTEPDGPPDRALFGRVITLERADGRRQRFRIVGEDEADPTSGAISYISPLARVVMGKSVGAVVELAGAEVEILSVETLDPAGDPPALLVSPKPL